MAFVYQGCSSPLTALISFERPHGLQKVNSLFTGFLVGAKEPQRSAKALDESSAQHFPDPQGNCTSQGRCGPIRQGGRAGISGVAIKALSAQVQVWLEELASQTKFITCLQGAYCNVDSSFRLRQFQCIIIDSIINI